MRLQSEFRDKSSFFVWDFLLWGVCKQRMVPLEGPVCSSSGGPAVAALRQYRAVRRVPEEGGRAPAQPQNSSPWKRPSWSSVQNNGGLGRNWVELVSKPVVEEQISSVAL